MIIGNTKKKKKDGDIAPIFSQETKQAIKNTFSSPESELAKAKIKLTWKDGYQVGDVTKTILNVRDMISPVAKAKRKGAEIGNKIVDTIQSGDFIKSSKTKQENKKIWDDGYQFGDITKTGLNVGKTVLGTTGDVAVNLVKGELQTAEGLVDTGRYIVSDITRSINPSKSFMARAHAIQNTTGVILGENDMYNRPKENGWAKKIDEYSIAGNSLDNIVQSVGQQAFRVGLQGAMGSAGASEGTQAAVNKLEIFAGSYGSAKSQALMNGADDKTATLKGFIGGTSEYISENLFDSIPGFKTGELKGVTKVKDIIGKSTEKAFGKTAGKAVVRIFSALGEGAEERLSNGLETALTDIVNCLDKSYTYGMEAGQGLTESTFGKNALKLFKDTYKSAFSKESDEAFVSAFFSTLITGAVADTMTNAERKQVIKAYAKDNNITTEQATKLFDNIRDLRLQQTVDNNTDYEQKTNIEDNLTKQLSQEIKTNKDLNLQELQEGLIARDKFTKAVGTGVVSSRGLDLVESYKAYNGDSKYTNEIQNIQKFMNNRNIDARFDATMFDNNEQNAIWTTENGQDSVVFNPNASQEQVIQSIATHEMTHDIINQKTEAGTSLFNDVLENIKSQENYAKNRQEIEDLYAKYYDRNSKDFAAKVDEEMVANELGKNLGTQEYINRLVNEKPNLAKRIYNWVVDKLDNIGKSDEYKEQKAYWKSVADKFEVAYNEQKTATGENKTAYSVKQSKAMLEKQFKELTGDSLLQAEAKLGNYAFQQLRGNKAEAPYNEQAMQIFNDIQNSRKTSSHLYHSTPVDRIQSIVQNGLQVGSKQNQEGVSSTNKLYLSATEDLASSFTPQDSVMLRISPTANLENLDNDLLGGEGSYTITNNIDPKYLQVKENGKWIPLLKSKYANQTKYSLNDYEAYQNELNETLNNTKNIGEDFYNNMKNQLDEYKERHPLEYNIYEQTKSRPATNENYNSDFFKEHRSDYDEKSGTNTADGRLTVLHLQKGDNLAKLSFTENQDKIWIDELYVKNQKQGYGSEIVNAIKDYAERTGKYVEAFKELQTAKGFWDKTLRNNTKYSLTKDNTGRELSKGQREYFKNSKAVDDDGNLVTVYHTMTNTGNQFNQFNPVGTDYYRFGDQVVNYYTDNQDMSGSYADQSYRKAYTKPINTMEDVQDFIDFQNTQSDSQIGVNGITNHYTIEKNGDGYIVKQNPSGKEYLSYINLSDKGKVALDRVKNNENLHKQFLNNEDSIKVLKNQLEEWYNTRQYDGYPELANVIDVYDRESGKLLSQASTYGEQRVIQQMLKMDLEEYLFNTKEFTKEQIDSALEHTLTKTFANEQDLINNIQNDFKAKYQYAGYINMTNPYIIDTFGENWDSVITERNQTKDEEYHRIVKDAETKEKLYKLAQESERLNKEYRHSGKDGELGQMSIIKNKIDNNELRETINDLGMFGFKYEEWLEAGRKNAEMFGEQFETNLPSGNELITNYVSDLNPAEQQIVQGMTINDFVNRYGELSVENNKYGTSSSYFQDQFYKTTGERLNTDIIGYTNMYNMAKYNFEGSMVDEILEERLTTNDLVKRIIEKNNSGETNYDGLIMKNVYDYGGQSNSSYRTTGDLYVTFNSNQFKAVDNLNPTEDVDIRYSMQQQETPVTPGTRTTMGELFENNMAPIREDLSNIREQMNNLSNQLETMQENLNINANSSNTVDEVQKILGLPDSKKEKLQEIIDRVVTNDYNVDEIANKIDNETTLFYDEINDADYNTTEEQIDRAAEYIRGIIDNNQETTQQIAPVQRNAYVEPFREQRYENESYTPLTEEEADLYQNALLNDEAYRKSLDEQADFEESNTKLINKLTKDVQDRLWLDKKQRDTLENIIRDAVDNELTTDEIAQRLSMEFSSQESRYTNQDIKDAKKIIKKMAIKVSDGIKKDIADYGDFQRRNYNKITFSRNGMPVDVAYQALQEQLPAYFSDDIINPTDQLLRISDVANMSNEIVERYDLPQDMFDDIADYIKESILDDEYNSQMEREASLDTDIRMNFTEDIAPTTIRTQESIDDFIENRDIAPIREDTPKQRNKSELRDRFDNMRRKFSEMVTNRNYVIDETARATGNNEIKYAGDNRNNVSGETQYNINNKQTDINGKWVGKGLNEIFAPAKNEGLADVFNDYLFHKSNIERHNVGKGSEVPSIVSQQLVAKYEQQYPQVKEWIKDLYKFEDNLLQEQVDSGIITQEKYNDYRGEHGIYRSYVPFYTGNIERSRYFDDEGNIRPVSTLKRSKGGAGDVNTMLSMEEAIARQVYASKRAIRDNELYKEIVSSLEKYEDMMDQDVRDNPTNLDDSLYITPDGDYVLSAYFDGEKVSAKISEELYNELAGTNESRIRQIEEDFSLITNPLQKVSNVRRNLLTTWNPTFLARNAIKDIQDAVINSKYTGDMLANYFGTKKGSKSAIMELRDAKTETAQQFLALYGADNLYGDYSNVGKSNKLVNKFSRINELIELAPRYAEFKATLENGGTINEAIYNAREVTTNFGRGGYITKALNRNGFTFLNANVQGLNKLIRNLSGENGAKGVTSVVAKGVAFALLPSILNHLLYGTGDDKDEEYDALPDYIKDNYYLIKLESGKFLRIPKGRINAVFGSAARRSIEALEGESDAFKGYGSNAWSQIGVGDLGSNNIFTPLTQAFGSKNGTAWYGGDIVPTRLQNVPAGEQTDASIDAVSNIIGKTFGISPYKINYVLDQYSGGLGDVLLPMMTEETTSGAENPLEYLTAPIKDSFIVNSTDDNKYAGDFYDTKDKLQVKSNSQYATDEDKLRYKYMSSVSSQMSDLYKERREVQADTTLGNKEKYAKVQAIQNEINSLAKEALNNYNNFATTDTYTNIGDVEYYKDAKGEWTKVKDDESEFTAGLNASEKTAYYSTKNKISGITQEYNDKTKDLDKDSPLKQQYSTERKENITRAITNSGLDNYSKAMLYSKYYSDKETMTNVVNAGYNVDTYITALSDIEALRTKYSQKNGYSTAQRKAKTLAYINSLDMNIPQKAMLTRQYYSSFRAYNKDIVNYVNNLDITQDEKVSILKDMGMTVKGNKVSWK